MCTNVLYGASAQLFKCKYIFITSCSFLLCSITQIPVLQDAREELRSSMAKDAVTIKNESLRSDEGENCTKIPPNANEGKLHTQLPKDLSLDFQKKITLSKHEKQDKAVNSFLGVQETYKQLVGMYKLGWIAYKVLIVL